MPTGEARQAGRGDIESLSVVSEPERSANTNRIMEDACERANLKEALRQVRGNKGSAGVDRMTVDQLGDYLKQHWPAIREQLLNGTYEPKPVRRVEIPKPDGGGMRKLGIPTVLDRFIQQAVMQVLQNDGTRRFPHTAMGFDRVDRRITPWLRRSNTSRKATDG
jgi:RNA-directed DNA polymerase